MFCAGMQYPSKAFLPSPLSQSSTKFPTVTLQCLDTKVNTITSESEAVSRSLLRQVCRWSFMSPRQTESLVQGCIECLTTIGGQSPLPFSLLLFQCVIQQEIFSWIFWRKFLFGLRSQNFLGISFRKFSSSSLGQRPHEEGGFFLDPLPPPKSLPPPSSPLVHPCPCSS